jgi:hypothetical protein
MNIVKPLLCSTIAGVGLLLPAAAGANDSTATLAAGGLVFAKSPSIKMLSEDLFLSENQVRVLYHFKNTAARAQTVEVAFPLPDLAPDPYDIEGSPVSVDAPTNFLGFKTRVDGKPVQAKVELKAVFKGVDETALMRRLHVPLNPFPDATGKALTNLSPANQQKLIKLGLAKRECCDVDSNGDTHDKKTLEGRWTLKTTYHWKQTFPAGREVTVEHQYVPVVGHWVANNWFVNPDSSMASAVEQERKEYCVDQNFVSAVRANKAGNKFLTDYLKYVLITGANWAGPIGDFKMTVDKGNAANMVSFCGDNVQKLGPTTFQVHYRNFTPKQDVGVLILTPR